jgi:hypothetical protein
VKYQDSDITDTWKKVQDGYNYNEKINFGDTNYYQMVSENYENVKGNQWAGVKSNGLPTPVINILKRVRDYKVSSLMSQQTTAQFSIENISSNTEDPQEQKLLGLVDVMNNLCESKGEKEKMDARFRECLMDSFTTGDMATYTYGDPNTETGQEATGDFHTELIDGVNVLFGNPNSNKVEGQPYIIILGRAVVTDLKEEAKANGIEKEKYDKITGDDDTEYTAGVRGKQELDRRGELQGKVTYAIKLWKKDGMVYSKKSTKWCDITEDVNLGIKKYPVCWGNWEKVKNSYHGQAEVTGMLPNQRYINKQLAMLMIRMMNNAMGKVAYDKNKIAGWSNQVGAAIPVNGDIGGAIQQLNSGNLNNGVFELFNLVTSETLQALGVNDVVLGDIKPENTSAIIAVQKQSAVPLENQQAYFHQLVEDQYLVWAEFIVRKYVADRQLPQRVDNETEYETFNAEPLQDKLINVKVDVGASSHWSEVTSQATLDQLLQGKYIDFIEYLERIGNGVVPKKQELIETRQQAQEQEAEFEQMEQILNSLPPEERAMFDQLPETEQENYLREFMQQQQ